MDKIFKSVEDKFGKIEGENAQIDNDFNRAMDDDFNTALAISNLYGYFKGLKAKISNDDKSALADASQIKKTYSLIGLFASNPVDFINDYEQKHKEEELPEQIKAIADERFLARQNKDFDFPPISFLLLIQLNLRQMPIFYLKGMEKYSKLMIYK